MNAFRTVWYYICCGMIFCLFLCILIAMPLAGMLCGIAFGFYMMYYLIKDAPKMLRETFDEMKKEPVKDYQCWHCGKEFSCAGSHDEVACPTCGAYQDAQELYDQYLGLWEEARKVATKIASKTEEFSIFPDPAEGQFGEADFCVHTYEPQGHETPQCSKCGHVYGHLHNQEN